MSGSPSHSLSSPYLCFHVFFHIAKTGKEHMYVKYVVNFLFQPASLHLYFCHLSSLLCTHSISSLPPPFLICPVFFLFYPSVTFPTFSPPHFRLMHVSLSLFFALLSWSICVFVFSGTFLHIFKYLPS